MGLRYLLLLTAIIMLVLHTGCNTTPANSSKSLLYSSSSRGDAQPTEQSTSSPESPSPSGIPSEQSAPWLPPVDDATKEIVRTLIPTGNILGYSWERPGQIAADDLISVCAYNNLLELPVHPLGLAISHGGEYKEPHAPAAEVEVAVQSMFDVSVDYLRTASLYEPDTDSYKMLSGWGGGWSYLPMGVEQSEGQTIITVGVSFDEKPPTEVGALTVEVSETGAIKYLSYVYTGE